MKVVYFSEVLNKAFATEAELVKAEEAFLAEQKRKQAWKDERAIRAKEVEDALDHASELMSKFIEDYGSFHRTTTRDNNWLAMLLSLFE